MSSHNPYEGQGQYSGANQQQGGQYGQGNMHQHQQQQQHNNQQYYQQQQQQQHPQPQQQQWDQPQQQQYQQQQYQQPQQHHYPNNQNNYQNQQPYQQQAGGQQPNGMNSGNNSFAGAPIRAGVNVNVGGGSLGALPPANRGPVSPTNPPVGPSDMVRPVPSGTQRVCRHFLQGKCTWGDSCRFLHDASKVSESNPPLSPPLSPPGAPPIVPPGVPPPHTGISPSILSLNPHGGQNPSVYGSQDCLPPALSGSMGSPSGQPGGHMGSAPSSPMANGSFGQNDVQPNVVIRSRASSTVLKSPPSGSQPGSRPLSPGAGGSQRYAHNPYGDQQLTPNGTGPLEPPSGY